MLSTAKYFKTKADYISFKPHRKVSCQQALIGTAKRVFLRFCAEALKLRKFKHNNSPE